MRVCSAAGHGSRDREGKTKKYNSRDLPLANLCYPGVVCITRWDGVSFHDSGVLLDMITDRLKAAALAGVASVALATAADAGVFVDATSATPVAIGTVTSGQSVTFSARGISDIYPALQALLTPSGAPAYDMTGTPTAGYMPNGSPIVQGTTSYGVAGASANIGALVGTYNANPTQPSDFFVLGNGGTFTPTQSGTLYAMINDQWYSDNCGGAFVSFGTGPIASQRNFACASSPPQAARTPIATLAAGHLYQFSASGTEVLNDGGPGAISNPAGISPQVNGYNTGALLLSLVPNPAAGDVIKVGADGIYRFIAPSDATLYAWVNASSYWLNTGGFVTQVTDVPEPMSVSLLLSGLGLVYGARRKGQRNS